jgi:hypothetical protein
MKNTFKCKANPSDVLEVRPSAAVSRPGGSFLIGTNSSTPRVSVALSKKQSLRLAALLIENAGE